MFSLADAERFVREIARILKEGGVFGVVEVSRAWSRNHVGTIGQGNRSGPAAAPAARGTTAAPAPGSTNDAAVRDHVTDWADNADHQLHRAAPA